MEPLWKLVYLLELPSIFLLITAVAVTYASASRALSYGKEMERNRDLSEASITLDSSQALMIPIVSSCSLLVMFYLFSSVSQILTVFTAVASASALYFCLSPYVAHIKSQFSLSDPYVSQCCSKPFTRIQSLLLFICIALVMAWIVSGHWVLNNILGISLCIAFVSHVRLPNIKICAMLLFCLFLYDIFWVFYSERIFGANVMVSVATQQASNPVHTVADSLSLPGLQLITKKLELPVKIVFPRNMLGGAVPGNNASEYMMLGLGDMAIPSMLLAMVLGFDHRKSRDSATSFDVQSSKAIFKYFPHAITGYAIGLVAALAAGILTRSPQPALLYLQVSEFDLFTFDDIDYAFQNITRLTYSQNYYMSGKGEGIVVAPHLAGHLLGGTIWKITKDGEDVIYAVDFNHRKERHLNGTVLDFFVRPAVLITDAYNALLINQPPRRQRDQEFLDAILRTLRADGKILVPVDTAGRVLELLLILEQYWEQHHLLFPIFFLVYVSSRTVYYAKSFLEWMSDSIAKSFDHTRDNAFLLKHVTLLINKSELENVPDGPKIVLASMASLEVGFAHDIFVEWAADVKNLVLFTERGQFATLARMLQSDPPPKAVKVIMSKRIPLVGEELAAYEDEQDRKREEEALKLLLSKRRNQKFPPELSPLGMILWLLIPASSILLQINSVEWDDFGEVVNPDDYVIKDEDMDQASMLADGDLNGKLDEGFASLIFDTTPSKVVSSEQTVYVKCSLTFLDFEGRSDGSSIKKILTHVSPLKLVLVHGSAEATEHLKQHCLKHVCPHVYAPQIEESIDVTSDLCAYKVQLSEKLMSNILFKKHGDYEIAWIDAEGGKTESGKLPLLPLSTPAPPHKTVLVGDIKMADFKQFLASKGIQVEFAGGALRCGDYVTLRKVGDSNQKGGGNIQHIILEGPLSEEYYKIRDHLGSQFYSL